MTQEQAHQVQELVNQGMRLKDAMQQVDNSVMDKRVDAYIEAYNAKAIEGHNSVNDIDEKEYEGLSDSEMEAKLEEFAFGILRAAIAAGIEAADRAKQVEGVK